MSQFKVGDKVVRGCGNYRGEVLNVLPPEIMINGELKPVTKGMRLVIAAHNEAIGKVSITTRCIDGTIDGNSSSTYTYRKVRPTITTRPIWVFVYSRLDPDEKGGKKIWSNPSCCTTHSERSAENMRKSPIFLIHSETYIPSKTVELPEGIELS